MQIRAPEYTYKWGLYTLIEFTYFALKKNMNSVLTMFRPRTYKPTDKMSDLICENYVMLQVLSRFGLSLGFGDKTIQEVCEGNGVDYKTFLIVVNFLLEDSDRMQDH